MANKKFRILFVCTGNTCRSPMAEGILKKMLKEKKIDFIQVSSAGTNSWGSRPASLSALEISASSGIDLKIHLSRRITREILEETDLVLVMSKDHLDYVRELNKDLLNKSFLLKAFPRRSDDNSFWIKDPIGGTKDDYKNCFFDLNESIKRIFPELIDLAKKKVQTPSK
jgi:protein-tyrosine-phosphatase